MPQFLGLTLPAVMELFFKGLIIIGIAFLLSRVLPSTSASFRHTVWLMALIALVIFPFNTIILPKIQMPLDNLSLWIQNGLGINEVSLSSDAGSAASGYTHNTVKILSILEYIYLMGIFITLIWFLSGFFLSFRLRFKAVPVQEMKINSLFQEIKDSLGIRQTVPLISAQSSGTPATLGIFKPSVYIPGQAVHWPQERLRIVLLHELAHIKRKDTASRFIGTVACAVHWFNPLVWLALRNMLQEQEFACDGYVVRNGIKPSLFASSLMVLAGKSTNCFGNHLTRLVRSDDLKLRLFELLKPSRKNMSIKISQIFIAGFSTVLLILGLSTVSLFSPLVKASEADLLAGAKIYFYGPIREAHQDVLDYQEMGDYFNGVNELIFSGDEFTKEEIEAHLNRLRIYVDWEDPSGKDEVQMTARGKMSLILERTQQWHEKYLPFKDRINSQ